jgi:hypothetical protein
MVESQLPPMTDEELRVFIAAHVWTFAKTMKNIPHEYTLLANAKDQTDFYRFVMQIRHAGYDRSFFGKIYRYLEIDEWCYWTMGSFLSETTLINRARMKNSTDPTTLDS